MEIGTQEFFNQSVRYIETTKPAPGVSCDVYEYIGDSTKDLGIICIEPGANTPLQKVLSGDRTIEGYISGKGRIVVHRHLDNNVFVEEIHHVSETSKRPYYVDIRVGDMIQLFADKDSELLIYEVCFPPYQDGRYQNIPSES
jgi:hypothetical protein